MYGLLNLKLRAPPNYNVISIAMIVEFTEFDASLICALILLVRSSNEYTHNREYRATVCKNLLFVI